MTKTVINICSPNVGASKCIMEILRAEEERNPKKNGDPLSCSPSEQWMHKQQNWATSAPCGPHRHMQNLPQDRQMSSHKKQLLKVQKVKFIGSIFSNPICVKMQIIHERKIHEYVEGKILAPKANRTNYKVERNKKKKRDKWGWKHNLLHVWNAKTVVLRGEITAVNDLTKEFSSVQSNFKHWRARERIIGPEVNRRKRLIRTRKETIQVKRIENKAKISETKLIFKI